MIGTEADTCCRHDAVAKAVGSGGQGLQPRDDIGSCSEVSRALGDWLRDARPAIDLAHGDLAGGNQRPEQYSGCLGRGKDGLGLDAVIGLLVQPLDRMRGPRRLPLAPPHAGEGKQLIPGPFEAVSDGMAAQPPSRSWRPPWRVTPWAKLTGAPVVFRSPGEHHTCHRRRRQSARPHTIDKMLDAMIELGLACEVTDMKPGLCYERTAFLHMLNQEGKA